MVSVALCAFCNEPYNYQVRNIQTYIKKRCSSPYYDIVEEGTALSGNYAIFMNAGGASAIGERRWYWVFECGQ